MGQTPSQRDADRLGAFRTFSDDESTFPYCQTAVISIFTSISIEYSNLFCLYRFTYTMKAGRPD